MLCKGVSQKTSEFFNGYFSVILYLVNTLAFSMTPSLGDSWELEVNPNVLLWICCAKRSSSKALQQHRKLWDIGLGDTTFTENVFAKGWERKALILLNEVKLIQFVSLWDF